MSMRYHTSITTLVKDEKMVSKTLTILNISKLPGPYCIHPRIMKECADSLTLLVTELFRRLLNEKQVPVDWKSASMSAIFMKGDKIIVSNYRPVNLASVICKVLKLIINDLLTSYLLDSDLISVRRFGFMHSRSTCLQLLNEAWKS